METYLFDTNIWSQWFRAESCVANKIAQLVLQREQSSRKRDGDVDNFL